MTERTNGKQTDQSAGTPLTIGQQRFPLTGTLVAEIERRTPGRPEYGTREKIVTPNVIVLGGQAMLALYISSQGLGTNSQMVAIAVGTATTVASLNQTGLTGEVSRKAFSATSVGANSWSAVTTFGGGADNIVGTVVAEAGVWNMTTSGQGVMFNRAVFGSTFTLQNSDIAAVQFIIAVGSR